MTYLTASFALAEGRHDAIGADMMSVTRLRQSQRGYPWMSHLGLVLLLQFLDLVFQWNGIENCR
jgi:hypothetical protein